MKNLLSVIIAMILSISVYAQNGSISGRVFNEINNEPIPFANVVIQNTTNGVTTDIDGKYFFENLKPGQYTLEVSYIGFKKKVQYEIQVTNARTAYVDFPLVEDVTSLEAVEVTATPFNRSQESPVSLRSINSAEIQRSPGGNRDISKVLQSLPGVASTVSFRNDIIIRGGAPNENRFYLDGIEVPNINHFATQGSSGGPVGMINVNFIREVDFYSGAFPANRGNALSSVLEFRQKNGNSDKLEGTFTLGSSDFGLTLDGPVGNKSSFIFSARRSYLQFLFKALKLPFLPTYNDFQYKHTFNFDKKNKLTLIGLAAIDDFELNSSVNDGVTDQEVLDRNDYILGNLPVNSQWNYTVGANYQHFGDKSFQNLIVSRSQLNNQSEKYFNNDESSQENLLLDYVSQEIENKVRYEYTYQEQGYRLNVGANYELATYTNNTFRKTNIGEEPFILNVDSRLNVHKGGIFGQISKSYLNDRLSLSFGLRTDFNDYSDEMINPLNQLSPRFSAAYFVTPKFSINFNTGKYYQLPAYTILGFRDEQNNLVNKDNGLKYIGVSHIVGGLEYNVGKFAKLTLEGFYKDYDNYPYSIQNGISLANLGGDFGVIGNEAVLSNSEGRSYGLEVLAQQKLNKGFYGIIAYTWVRSEFKDDEGTYRPSAWDNRHIVSLTGGKKFARNWELGMKWRFSGGSPFTPYNRELSAKKVVWDVNGRGLFDYARLNEQRTSVVHGLDVRVDKKYFFNRWTLNVYFDIQNIYNFQAQLQSDLNVKRDENGNKITSVSDPNSYELYDIANTSGTVLPSIGLMVEF